MNFRVQSLFHLFFHVLLFATLANAITEFHVGVVLDMNSSTGKVGWGCIGIALTDFYAAHPEYKTRLSLHHRDSEGDNIKASLAVLDLLENVEVQTVIGPQTSTEAGFAIDLGDRAHVPIISFTATSPSLAFRTPYFVQAAQSDASQLRAAIAIIQAFNWREVVTIYENSDYGNGGIPLLIDTLQEYQVRVAYRSVISLLASDDQIRLELSKLSKMRYRVFVVHMSQALGTRLFPLAKELGMMKEGYVWIITDGVMNFLDSMESSVIASMQGVFGVRPYIQRSPKTDNLNDRLRRSVHQDVNVYGLWAYDTVWSLAMAAERVGTTGSSSKNPKTSCNLTQLATIEISRTGPKLLDVILNTRFNGLSGDFYFVSGQLQSDVVQILNVVGKGGREVGFWTSKHGIHKKLNSQNDNTYSTSSKDLRGIIWPGDSLNSPKGWEVLLGGKKLRVGVPVKYGFDEFARIHRDVSTNKTTVSGYSIDVFNLVMEALPYPVAYEFQPFIYANGSSAGNHNDLIYELFLGRYDAVVGGMTINENRSKYVDFTLAYAEGGVSMMQPLRYVDRKGAWFFSKPLSRELWMTIGAFFILTGFVVWVLEHRVNEAFRGPLSNNAGMILCFPLSTAVYAHRERIVSNLTRLVVITWIFVVVVLNSSYTANLSSILTADRLTPVITTRDQLKKNGDLVGYQKGSCVLDILEGDNFSKSKLKAFISKKEMDEALQNRTISAFFSRAPYIKLYTAMYGSRYTEVEPRIPTEGFGFAFPRGSPLGADVTRAILKVSHGTKMSELKRAFYAVEATAEDPAKKTIGQIKPKNFRVLFIITGTVSGLALLVFFVMFLYKNKQVLTASDSDTAMWAKIKAVLKKFDEKDLTSHNFREVRSMHMGSSPSFSSVEMDSSPTSTSASLYADRNQSPSSGSIQIHENDIALEEMDDVIL